MRLARGLETSCRCCCDSLAAHPYGDRRAAVDLFAGCVVVISHDRWFLDRIATHILDFEGESKVTFFDGTVRRAGRVARRGLHGRRPELRGSDAGCAMPRPTPKRCSRNLSEYEA